MKKYLFLNLMMIISLFSACSEDDNNASPEDHNVPEKDTIQKIGNELVPLKLGNLWEYISYEYNSVTNQDTVVKTGRYAYQIKYPELSSIAWSDPATYLILPDYILTYKLWERVDNLKLDRECQGGGVINGFGIKGNQLLIPITARFNDTLYQFELSKMVPLDTVNNCVEIIKGVEYPACSITLKQGYNTFDRIWLVRGIGVVRREMSMEYGHTLGFRLVNNRIK